MIVTVVADDSVFRAVVCQCDITILATQDVSTSGTLNVRRKAATIQQKNHLALVANGLRDRLLQRATDGASCIAVLELDALRVKGKKEPEVVYTLLRTSKPMGDEELETLKDQMSSLLTAYRGRNWTAAARALKVLRKTDGHSIDVDLSALFDLYEGRIREFKKNPPPKNWDGVFTLQTK